MEQALSQEEVCDLLHAAPFQNILPRPYCKGMLNSKGSVNYCTWIQLIAVLSCCSSGQWCRHGLCTGKEWSLIRWMFNTVHSQFVTVFWVPCTKVCLGFIVDVFLLSCLLRLLRSLWLALQIKHFQTTAHRMMQLHYLWVIKFYWNNLQLPDITATFLFHMNETWNGNFLWTVDNKYASYVASVFILCMVGIKTPFDTQGNITVLTVYSSSTFVLHATEQTSSDWYILYFSPVTGLLLGHYHSLSLFMVFLPPSCLILYTSLNISLRSPQK
jgi:hypothetical protein